MKVTGRYGRGWEGGGSGPLDPRGQLRPRVCYRTATRVVDGGGGAETDNDQLVVVSPLITHVHSYISPVIDRVGDRIIQLRRGRSAWRRTNELFIHSARQRAARWTVEPYMPRGAQQEPH